MKRQKGRPKSDRGRDAFTGARRIALRVFELELKYGRKRGDLTRATHVIAAQFQQASEPSDRAYQRVKRAVSRYQQLRLMADILAVARADPLSVRARAFDEAMNVVAVELERRTSGIPQDVRDVLLQANYGELLEFLRANKIHITSALSERPYWVVLLAVILARRSEGEASTRGPRRSICVLSANGTARCGTLQLPR